MRSLRHDPPLVGAHLRFAPRCSCGVVQVERVAQFVELKERSMSMNILWRFMDRADTWILKGIVIGIVGVIIIQVWIVR